MGAVRDFRVTNVGPSIVLLLLDAKGDEVWRMTLSWISGVRLASEAAMAARLALKATFVPGSK